MLGSNSLKRDLQFPKMESRSQISQYFVQQNVPVQEEEEDTEAVWVRREAARMRQIAIGKARPEYRRYIAEVPVNLREPVHPSTPNPKDRVSKRQFDRALGDWRRRLHEFDAELGFDETRPPSAEGPVQPGAMSRTPTHTPGPFGGEAFLPRHAVPPPKSPPRPQEKLPATVPQVSPSLVPQHPPPSQPPMMDGGVVQLHLADQLPAPIPQAPQGPAPMQAHPEPPHVNVDLASAAAIGVAAAMTAIFRGQHCAPCGCAPPTWNCEMQCDPNMMYVPHMEPGVPMMCDAASSSFMAQPMMNVAPETPLRGRQMPMDDGETPPPVCPFWTQATQANSENNFVPFQKAVLGAVTEECERGTKLTYEDAMSPCSGNRGQHLSVPKEPMPPMTPPRDTRRAAVSPSSVIQTPKPGWVVETPSPNSWLSRNFDPSW